jgi:hypothetical protein
MWLNVRGNPAEHGMVAWCVQQGPPWDSPVVHQQTTAAGTFGVHASVRHDHRCIARQETAPANAGKERSICATWTAEAAVVTGC